MGNELLHISEAGLDLVTHFEGLYLVAYRCQAGIWTIGWGHTGLIHNDGTVFEGRTITREEARSLMKRDMLKYETGVRKVVKVPLAQHEFDALVAFHFNTGSLGSSTLLKMLNRGDRPGAAEQFLRWTKVKVRGRMIVSNGLVRRRNAERAMFLGQSWEKFRSK
jgi:lysozyme